MDAACKPALLVSPGQMAGRLIAPAHDAERAGFTVLAAGLVILVHAVLDLAGGTSG